MQQNPQPTLFYTREAQRQDEKHFLAAFTIDFRHHDDGRKWAHQCELKRQVARGLAKLHCFATERELSNFLHIPRRTVRRGIRLLLKQGFISNLKRPGPWTAIPKELHSAALRRECGHPTRIERGRLNTPRASRRGSEGFERKPQEKNYACGKQHATAGHTRGENLLTGKPNPCNPTMSYHQDRYRRVGLFTKAIEHLRAQGQDDVSIHETIKELAASIGMPYADHLPGRSLPIEKAFDIADIRAASNQQNLHDWRRKSLRR